MDLKMHTSSIWKISKFIIKMIEFFKIILRVFATIWLKLLKISDDFSFYFFYFFWNFPLNVLNNFFNIKSKTFF